jgi:hypothetical protein
MSTLTPFERSIVRYFKRKAEEGIDALVHACVDAYARGTNVVDMLYKIMGVPNGTYFDLRRELLNADTKGATP